MFDLSFDLFDLCFDFHDQNWVWFESLDLVRVCFEFVLDTKLLLDRGISVALDRPAKSKLRKSNLVEQGRNIH